MLLTSIFEVSAANLIIVSTTIFILLLLSRVFYNLYLHPLAGFPGPWYAASTSLATAITSVINREPQWLLELTKKYGTDRPIRITPNLLLFPKVADMREIYCDPKLNTKSLFYGSGALGPPHLFSTLDADEHRTLRKALGGPQWTMGSLKNIWEPRIDDLITIFTQRMTEFSETKTEIVISDKAAEFAADVLTMLSFTKPWGFVDNQRDEGDYLKSWRKGLPYFGVYNRWNSFRDYVLKSPTLSPYFLPSTNDKTGMGFLASHADKAIKGREIEIEKANGHWQMNNPDLLQYCIDARFPDGSPLNDIQRRAHMTLIIQAGADTTGTAMGCTLRNLMTHPDVLRKAQAEIDAAEAAGKLSRPISYEESRKYLPYCGACIKESMRITPPTPNLLPRVVGPGGKTIGKDFIPAGAEVTSHAYVLPRDTDFYGPDADVFRPERWLEPGRDVELENSLFTFSIGPRVCLGKDIATMEMWKFLPEMVRNFDLKMLEVGKYVVAGGIGYNENLRVQLTRRI
ncbi:cytochrome P450 [Hypoxylon crocopeplum]|nr:cytochrome P450 [Hypoxylon crocopeplum]